MQQEWLPGMYSCTSISMENQMTPRRTLDVGKQKLHMQVDTIVFFVFQEKVEESEEHYSGL